MTTLSEFLTLDYIVFVHQVSGHWYPMNDVDIDLEAGMGFIGHTVADSDPPITLKNGQIVRKIGVHYSLEAIQGLKTI
jgi:hypothetical protein